MAKFRLRDWNDVRILLACAEHGSFARAAAVLQVQQTTVSRRIAFIEEAAGRPLFRRERSGAAPTEAGLELLAAAREVRAKTLQFEERLGALRDLPPKTVAIAAPDGLVAYTLAPLLGGDRSHYLPLDPRELSAAPPPIAFAQYGLGGDISILGASPGQIPAVPSTHRVRNIGAMVLSPVVGRRFRHGRSITRFDELRKVPLIHNRIYRAFHGLDDWNSLVDQRAEESKVELVGSTPAMHRPLLAGQGVALLPSYSTLYDRRLRPMDLSAPQLTIPLWLAAHADRLREPSVRWMFDSLATLFTRSPWFR